jgi:hypothetical protein
MTDDSNLFSTPDTSFLGDRPDDSARKSALATPSMAHEDCSPLELVANERRNFMLAAQAVCADTYCADAVGLGCTALAAPGALSSSHPPSRQMHKLGGVPPVPLPSLASAVSLDGHVDYVPYVAQLCARLMQLGHNAAAASTIQAWCVRGPGQ